MGAKRGKNYTAELKARVVIDALRGDLTLNEISVKYRVHTTQINRWKQEAILSIKSCFSGNQEKIAQNDQHLIDDLYRQIGQLTCENGFLKKSLRK